MLFLVLVVAASQRERDVKVRRLEAALNRLSRTKRMAALGRMGSSSRRRDELTPEEIAGIAKGELCESKSRAGQRRALPRFGPVEWGSKGPVALGLECVESGAQLCCRRSAAGDRLLRQHHAYARMVGRALDGDWRCFPSLIIAGAQKCGSTALTGFLLHHPGLRFGRAKELHYFDKNESQCVGALPYLMHFPPTTLEPAFVTAEATPFYLADSQACARMASQVPRAKLVVLVREPVARARSEYEMKARRVVAQDEFAAALGRHDVASRLLECFVQVGHGNVSAGLGDCAPQVLARHAKFPLFKSAVTRQLRLARQHAVDKRYYSKWLASCFVPTAGTGLSDGVASAIFPLDPPSAVFFATNECFTMGTKERVVGDFEDVMRSEMTELETCARDKGFASDWGGGLVPPTAHEAARLIAACVRVRTGISIQYVYRGLYAGQLARCASHVDMTRILVIESDDLRKRPQEQLDRVADHLGMQRHVYDPRLFEPESAALASAIRDKFPTFENSGWQLKTYYQTPLDDAVRASLAAWFMPHNRLFFRLVGRDFPHWDPSFRK